MNDPNIPDQVRALLENEDRTARLHGAARLRDAFPNEALQVVVSLLDAPEEKLRRRAGSILSLFPEIPEPIGGRLADHVRNNEDPAVRLSCAIVLMSVISPAVDAAYLHALADPFEKVAQIACMEVGQRCGAQGTTALLETLGHPHWRVRLEACKALIVQGTADQQVVSALETMSREPEAAVYDEQIADFGRITEEVGGNEELGEMWGDLASILGQAREVAGRIPQGG